MTINSEFGPSHSKDTSNGSKKAFPSDSLENTKILRIKKVTASVLEGRTAGAGTSPDIVCQSEFFNPLCGEVLYSSGFRRSAIRMRRSARYINWITSSGS